MRTNKRRLGGTNAKILSPAATSRRRRDLGDSRKLLISSESNDDFLSPEDQLAINTQNHARVRQPILARQIGPPLSPPATSALIQTSPLFREAQSAIDSARTETVKTKKNGALSLALNLGRRLLNQGRVEEAQQILENVQSISQLDPSESISIGIINLSQAIKGHGRLLGGDRLTEIQRALDEAIERDNVDGIVEVAQAASNYYFAVSDSEADWQRKEAGAIEIMRIAKENLEVIAELNAVDLNIDEFNRIRTLIANSFPAFLGREDISPVIHTLVRAEDVHIEGQVVKEVNDGTYIFSSREYASLTAEEKRLIADATAFVQAAVKRAYNDLISGNIAHFEGSGHLNAWRRHVQERRVTPLDAAAVGSLIEYRAMNIIRSQVRANTLMGLGFAEQKNVGRISGTSDAVPDIVLTTPSGKVIYLDITANSAHSVGHVLGKGGGILRNDAYLAETTYPQVDVSNITYNPNNPPNRDLTQEEIAAITQRFREIERLQTGLGTRRDNIKDLLQRVSSNLDGLTQTLIDGRSVDSPEKARNVRDMLVRLSGYQPASFIANTSTFVSTGERALHDAVRELNTALNTWWNLSGVDEFKTANIRRLKTELEQYETELDRIDTLRRG